MGTTIETLVCRTCKAEKPVTEFHRDRKKPTGYSLHCRDCTVIITHNRRSQRAPKAGTERDLSFLCNLAAVKQGTMIVFGDVTADAPQGNRPAIRPMPIQIDTKEDFERELTLAVDNRIATEMRIHGITDFTRVMVTVDPVVREAGFSAGCDVLLVRVSVRTW